MNLQSVANGARVVFSPTRDSVPPAAAGSGGQGTASSTQASQDARKDFLKAAQRLRDAVDPTMRTVAQYQVDPHSRSVSVQIVDQISGEVIHSFPPEELVRFAESWDAYVGKLLDHDKGLLTAHV